MSVNGLVAFDAELARPRVGPWHWDLRVDDPEAIAGAGGAVQVVVDDGFQTFKGTALPSRSAEFVDTAQLRVVAGAGGLGTSAKPQHYNGTTVGIVLGDLLRTAGEQLAGSADSGTLGVELDTWTTIALPVGVVIGMLLQAAAPGIGWRMLPDGTFWLGPETWPDSGLDPFTYQILDQSAEEGSMLVAVDRPCLDPGTTFEGRLVSYVQSNVPHIEGVTMRVWFEDATISPVGRFREMLARLVRATPATVDYRGRYWAKVISQSGNLIEVIPEDPRVPDMGQIVLVGPAGMSQDGVIGGRVLVGWTGANGTGAYAEAFDGGETVTKRVIAATLAYLGAELGAEPPPKGVTQAAALSTAFAAINTYAVAIAAIADPTHVVTPALTAAMATVEAALSSALAIHARVA